MNAKQAARAAQVFLDRLLAEQMPSESTEDRDIYVLAPRLAEAYTTIALAGALAAALVELRRLRTREEAHRKAAR